MASRMARRRSPAMASADRHDQAGILALNFVRVKVFVYLCTLSIDRHRPRRRTPSKEFDAVAPDPRSGLCASASARWRMAEAQAPTCPAPALPQRGLRDREHTHSAVVRRVVAHRQEKLGYCASTEHDALAAPCLGRLASGRNPEQKGDCALRLDDVGPNYPFCLRLGPRGLLARCGCWAACLP